jgi:amidase
MTNHFSDGIDQAQRIESGDSSAVAEVERAIDRINQVNPHLNAVIHRRDQGARRDGEEFDARKKPNASPVFGGVPIVIKDALVQQAGEPYHVGMKVLRDRDWRASHDSFLMSKFLKAGFIPVGRSNVPEWATCYTTEPIAYGATHNPWKLGYSSGGSSGGSAAAVASGIAAVAHGNDMGGSIRLPASYCGLIGLKPTRARTSLAPDFGEYWAMLAHEGVLTRTVRDTAYALDAIAGMSHGDPYTAAPFTSPLHECLNREIRPLRIGVRTRTPGALEESHSDCVEAVMDAARALEGLGHEVVLDCGPEMDMDIGAAFACVFTTSVALDRQRWSRILGRELGEEDVEPRNWSLIEAGNRSTGVEYLDSVETLQLFSRKVATWWSEGFDLLLTPTTPQPPQPLGRMSAKPTPAQTAELGEFCGPFNVTGQPAMSIPGFWNADGLPVGVQLVADYGREDLLIAVASQLEDVRPWVHGWDRMTDSIGSFSELKSGSSAGL